MTLKLFVKPHTNYYLKEQYKTIGVALEEMNIAKCIEAFSLNEQLNGKCLL